MLKQPPSLLHFIKSYIYRYNFECLVNERRTAKRTRTPIEKFRSVNDRTEFFDRFWCLCWTDYSAINSGELMGRSNDEKVQFLFCLIRYLFLDCFLSSLSNWLMLAAKANFFFHLLTQLTSSYFYHSYYITYVAKFKLFQLKSYWKSISKFLELELPELPNPNLPFFRRLP